MTQKQLNREVRREVKAMETKCNESKQGCKCKQLVYENGRYSSLVK